MMDRDFDVLVKELNDFLAEEGRLHRSGWKGYVSQVWNSIFSKRVLHPTYSRKDLTGPQKDAIAQASDIMRVKNELLAKRDVFVIEFGAAQYEEMLRLCDHIYRTFKNLFELQ